MTVAYWVLAGLLAALYLFSGLKKATQSKDQLRPMMAWVDDMPLSRVRAIGVVEVLGAVGLILPPLLGIAPWLAFAAAVGFVLVQVGATWLHLSRGETKVIGLNVVLLALAGVTVWLATIWLP
jgi:uncharacterized membrane protein